MTTCQVFIKIWIVSSVEFVDWKFPDGMRPYKSWIKCWLIYHWLIICHLRFTKIAGIRKIHSIQVLTCSDNFHHFRDICEASWKNTLSNRLEFHCSLFFYSNIYVKHDSMLAGAYICQNTIWWLLLVSHPRMVFFSKTHSLFIVKTCSEESKAIWGHVQEVQQLKNHRQRTGQSSSQTVHCHQPWNQFIKASCSLTCDWSVMKNHSSAFIG